MHMIKLMQNKTNRTIWKSFGDVLDEERPVARITFGDICLVLTQVKVKSDDFSQDSFVLTPDGACGWMGDIPEDQFL